MRQSAINTPSAQSMWVTFYAVTNLLFSDILSPNACIRNKETLFGREAIFDSEWLNCHIVL